MTYFFKLLYEIQKAKKGARLNDIEEQKYLKFQKNIENALKRAEEIKQKLKNFPQKSNNQQQQQPDSSLNNLPIINKLSLETNNDNQSSFQDDDENENNRFMNELALSKMNSGQTSSSSFTREEISVLRHGSFINNREYVPFFPEIDSKEKFFFPIPFSDKIGKLALSPSQLERFSRWTRPDEIFERPCLMMQISCFSVKQTCISDCSFVASLTVCAQYERKFNKKILSK
jgi:hypothetical protein